jgi:hypothetical protein
MHLLEQDFRVHFIDLSEMKLPFLLLGFQCVVLGSPSNGSHAGLQKTQVVLDILGPL